MKIRFLKRTTVEIEQNNKEYDDFYCKTFNKGSELRVEKIDANGSVASIKLYYGGNIKFVPIDAFEVVKEQNPLTQALLT